MNTSIDILAFGAHPDDIEIGCGGSLILAADQGMKIGVADLTDAEMSTRGTVDKRKEETGEASRLIGLSQRWALGLPDTLVGTDADHVLPIIQLIRETRPRIVLAPYWEDRHPDHSAVGKLVRKACFLAGVAKVGKGARHRPTSIFHYMISHPFEPSFVVDVSAVWNRKIAAIEAYVSQFQSGGKDQNTALSQIGFMKFIEARSIYFGAMIGAAHGEAFYMPGPVPLGELPSRGDSALSPGALPPYSMY
ncbi:MAG TPA: bacillithiol biosynthesis deacetylase BshB1 [candidate division Zixibacteria bacterium]|nr:bacillithiol biosynthesis deacetylase BshB1 [candidate division Zixibacteria bacterium]